MAQKWDSQGKAKDKGAKGSLHWQHQQIAYSPRGICILYKMSFPVFQFLDPFWSQSVVSRLQICRVNIL